MTAQAFRNKWHNARRDVFAYIDTQPHFCCWMRTKACVKTYQTQMNENPASLWYTRSSTLVNTITVSRLIRFRESVRFSELAQIHRACSQNWTVSCNQISISINILLNTEYSCICCNYTVLVTVKWLTNALRNCSNESVRMNDSFANRTSVKQRYRMNTASVVLRVYQMGDGQPRDPRYILMTFTEISTAVRSTNMWKIFESFTFQIFVQDLGLKLTIFNSTPNSVYFYQKIKKGCGTVPWYSDVNTMVYTMVLKCSYVVFTRVHIRVHFCHLLVKHCKCLLILGFNVCILQ